MRQKLVIGNWKMNGSFFATKELIQSIDEAINAKIDCEIAVCVPFVYLSSAASLLQTSQIKLAAQNVSEYSKGAYTGEVSAQMLKDCECELVLVGHSERRQYFNETAEQLVSKVIEAQKNGLKVVFCLGETKEEREEGRAHKVIEQQLALLLDSAEVDFDKLVIAYEPIWAIGTGLTASPEQAQEIHAFIRAIIKNKLSAIAEKIQILYGGSVNDKNAELLFKQTDIDGGLVGGASLDAKAFAAICQQAKKEKL